MPPPLEDPQIRTWTHIHMSSSPLLMNETPQSLTMILHTLMDWTSVKSLTSLLVTPCLMPMESSMSASIANFNVLLDAPPEACGSCTDISPVLTANLQQSSAQETAWNALRPFLHGHPHPASRTLSMSPPGMGLLPTPRIASKITLSIAILFSTSPDAVKLLQQIPSFLTLLLLMMVQPWPNSSVAVILLFVMPMASNQPKHSSKPSLITSENREPWIPSSVMEANMKSPSELLISSVHYSSKIISLNLITNTKIRLKIALDLPSITPTLS